MAHLIRLGALVLVAALAAGCALLPNEPPSGPAGPVAAAAVAEREGVRVTLEVDRQRVVVGGRVKARVTVTNFQPGIVFWQGGGCDLQGAFLLTGPDQGVPDPGREWPGELGILKLVSLGGELGGFVPEAALDQGQSTIGCPADLRVNELAFGETVSAEAVWPGTMIDGLPAAPGAYVVSVSFPFLARLAAGPFPGDPIDDRRPIDVQLPFAVEGSPVEAISHGKAIDAALGHAPFASWLADTPRPRWLGAQMNYANGTWVYTLRVGMPDERAIVTIDAATGAVRDFRVVPGL